MIVDIICHFILKITINFGLPVAATEIWRMEFSRLILSCVYLLVIHNLIRILNLMKSNLQTNISVLQINKKCL